MSGTTIRRGGKGVRRATAARGKARAVRGARQKTGGFLESLFAAVPISDRMLQRLFLVVIVIAVLSGVWALAVWSGVPGLVQDRTARAARDMGFTVRRVEVRGVDRMDRQAIYERAIAAREVAMPLLDLDGLRGELIDLPWVQDARVSRQLPDTLVIDIVERRPHAVLREGEDYVLIDPSGHRLQPVPRAQAEKMLILSGEGVDAQAPDLTVLLDAAPALKPQVRGAEWVGHRRWNLTFATGQVIALPEGAKEAADALVAFARMDGMNRLLGGRVAVFDMRADDRIYMRIPGRAEQEKEQAAERKRLAAEAERRASGISENGG